MRMIGELGLRYRPSAQADLEAHAAAIALLARDVADIPPAYLRQAIDQWVRRSPFMPKASDLVSLAQQALSAAQPVDHAATSREFAIDQEVRERRYRARTRDEIEDVWTWERKERHEAGLHLAPLAPPFSREELDNMPDHIAALGLKCGHLVRIDRRLVETAS